MTGRERAVTQAFVAIATQLARGYDIVEMLNTLTQECSRLLDVASAGLLLADARGTLHVMAASSERTRELEVLQLQRDDGPCLDAYRDASPVLVPDLAHTGDRWPDFVPAARDAGFVSAHALPLRLQETVLGAMGLFGTTVGALNDDDLILAQALADVAAVALVQDQAAADASTLSHQLQSALSSRVVLEQAKGVLAQQGHLTMEESFSLLRQYTRDRHERLTDVARSVVTRDLPAQTILDHNRARTRRA